MGLSIGEGYKDTYLNRSGYKTYLATGEPFPSNDVFLQDKIDSTMENG